MENIFLKKVEMQACGAACKSTDASLMFGLLMQVLFTDSDNILNHWLQMQRPTAKMVPPRTNLQ